MTFQFTPRRLIYILLLLPFKIFCFASIDTIPAQNLDEVVITAQHSPTLESKALYKVYVVPRQTINTLGANNLRELLLNDINLNIKQHTVFGSSIEIQGVSKENIKILVDGMPIIGRLNGIIDLNQISLLNIQKVEMIQGPVSVIYGTDATGGVINLITNKYLDKKRNCLASLYYESIDAFQADVSLGLKLNNDQIRISSSLYDFNGFRSIASARVNNWEPRRQYNSNVHYLKKIRNLSLSLQGQYFKEELNSLGDTVKSRSGQKSITDLDYFTSRYSILSNLNGNIHRNYYLDATIDYQNYERFNNPYNVNLTDGSRTPSTVNPKENNIEVFDQWHTRSQISSNTTSSPLQWTSGLEAQQESAKGERIESGQKKISTIAIYQTLQYNLKNNFQIQGALRYSYNDIYGSAWIPSFQSKINFREKTTLRVTLARGFRAPSLKELFLDFKIAAGPVTYHIAGNPELETESSYHIQSNFSHAINHNFTVENSCFYNDIKNQIVLSELVNNNRNYLNIDKFRSYGTSVLLKFQNNNGFSFSTSGGIIGRYNKVSEQYDSPTFVYSPEVSALLKYEVPYLKLILSSFYKYTGKTPGYIVDKGNVLEVSKNDFHNINLTLSRNFSNNKIECYFGVKNLLDVQNIDTFNESGTAHTTDYQLWGRTYFFKTTLKI
ncbi:MAG: TonB-dependent receptor [Lewinellaceae bacterium]|nr:TonB-dependent receptor [Lewinellaceae bacterium]